MNAFLVRETVCARCGQEHGPDCGKTAVRSETSPMQGFGGRATISPHTDGPKRGMIRRIHHHGVLEVEDAVL